MTVDCGEISRSLIGSALYGRERGAFTGAVVRKEGMLAQADTGTVSLDEIAEVLGSRPETVKVNPWLARKRLREVLAGDLRESTK